MSRDRRGFSLLEAVVALLILGLTAIAAMEAVGTELRAHEKAQRAMEAESLAEYQLSLVQMLFYEDFQAFPDSLANGEFPAPFDNYRYTTRVETVQNEENLYAVTMDVTWPGGDYSVSTMVYRRPQELTFTGTGAAGNTGGRAGGGGGGNDAGGRGGGNQGGGRGGGDAGGRGGGGRGGARGGRIAGPGPGRAGTTTGPGRGTTVPGAPIRRTPPDTGGAGGGVQMEHLQW